MALCVEVHVLSAGTAGSALKVDGGGNGSAQALLPSLTQTEINCTGYILETAQEYQSHVGFFEGVTHEDVVLVSWLVAGVLASAWGFKVLRRTV